MKSIYKFGLIIALLASSFALNLSVQATGEATINTFSLSPNVVPTTSGCGSFSSCSDKFDMTISGTLDLTKFNSSCGANNNTLNWYIDTDTGPTVLNSKANGTFNVSRTADPVPVNISQSVSFTLNTNQELNGGDVNYYAKWFCSTGTISRIEVAISKPFKVTYGTYNSNDLIWACVAANNKYSCSPQNRPNLSDITDGSCTGKTPIQIGKNLCGKDADTSNIWACVADNGKYACSPSNKQDLSDVPSSACTGKNAIQISSTKCGQMAGSTGGLGPPGGTTSTQSYKYTIENPLVGGPQSPFDVINIVSGWLLAISIPLAVLFILYAGYLLLTAGPNPQKVKQARQILWNVVLALAIIFIGRGFITLIKSILQLGPATTSDTAPSAAGAECSQDSNCGGNGLVCNTGNSTCQFSGGNPASEPCVSDTNCAQGTFCDTALGSKTMTVDGRTLHLCKAP